jgi:molybdenum cofactor biosynthesis enzyme
MKPETTAAIANREVKKGDVIAVARVAGIQAANIASMTSIGIGEASILNEAKFNFQDFTYIDEAFLNSLINN